MTELLYILDPDLFEAEGVVTAWSADARGCYLTLNCTLFYPQGGGQPADQGVIFWNGCAYNVSDVRHVEGQIRHYITPSTEMDMQSPNIRMVVNREKRILNSRYHSAGHLIAAVVEQLAPELTAVKGHQFPGEAFIEFRGTIPDTVDFMQRLNRAIAEEEKVHKSITTQDLSPEDAKTLDINGSLPEKKRLRVCLIAGFAPVPCGGTHVKSTEEIGTIFIKNCKCKKDATKIYYELSP